MNAETVSPAAEINRLYAEAQRLSQESSQCLHAALVAAWQAGRLLLAEKKRVRRAMGGGGWLLWLKQNFHGSPRTAQNYMRLAQSVDDVAFLHGMSLRQVYLRLGIATEPKSRAESPHVEALPSRVRLANKLLVALKTEMRRAGPARRAACCQDLRALYEELRRLFESVGTVNFGGPRVS